MIKFGNIKSKIEEKLLESYSNNTFKTEMKNFKSLVLGNKNISKLFYLYDEMSSNKGINESLVNDYIYECITIYENTINKIEDNTISNLKKWVSNVNCENKYENIDNLFSTDVLTIESRLKSKKIISENLIKSPENKKVETVNLPISTMVNIANKTFSNYVESLNESDRKELINFLKTDESELEPQYESIKNEVKSKLISIVESTSDTETLERVNETITKVDSETFNKLNYFKLKNLNENL
jgi:uncharacterized protein with von Willebrand factor type A (vWA) domain